MSKKAGPLAKSIRGLLELHEMLLAGDGALNSAAADCIRDECDKPWHEMNDEQKALVNKMSKMLLVEAEKS